MADHLRWADRPRLDRPVLIAAFEGWNDAGDAATVAAQYLRDRWNARSFAAIDPEEFYDFTSTRPRVQLDDDGQREIVWPGTEFSGGRVEPAGPDVIVALGSEPQLRWRTFCEQITDIAALYDVRLVVTLGALLAEVAHSKPVSVIGTSYDPAVVDGLGLRRSTYQGPTGIVGVLHDACRRAGLPTASLWAAVPTYVSSAPSPKAALALVERTAQLLDVGVVTTDLEIAAASYERQINTLVAADDETAAYVAHLESEVDEDDDDDDEVDEMAGAVDDSPGALIEEVERFLRDQD